ncbi:unnamed protein product, partial [Polarella glacialis]
FTRGRSLLLSLAAASVAEVLGANIYQVNSGAGYPCDSPGSGWIKVADATECEAAAASGVGPWMGSVNSATYPGSFSCSWTVAGGGVRWNVIVPGAVPAGHDFRMICYQINPETSTTTVTETSTSITSTSTSSSTSTVSSTSSTGNKLVVSCAPTACNPNAVGFLAADDAYSSKVEMSCEEVTEMRYQPILVYDTYTATSVIRTTIINSFTDDTGLAVTDGLEAWVSAWSDLGDIVTNWTVLVEEADQLRIGRTYKFCIDPSGPGSWNGITLSEVEVYFSVYIPGAPLRC